MEPFLIPFKSHHVEYLRMRPLDEKVFLSVPHSPREVMAYERGGYSWTGICSSTDTEHCVPTILGMGGVTPIWKGVACAWLLTGCSIEKYKKFLHRTVTNVLNEAIKNLGLHRIETTILVSHNVSQRWAERLGFANEGLLKKFDSNKNDYYRYALVKPWI